MPFGKWEDFDACVQDFLSQGKDEKSANQICGALQARLGNESFSWTGSIERDGKNLIRGKALHPIKTVHPEEWPAVRVYLEEELEKAAHSLSGTSLLLDHMYPVDGKVIGAKYEDGAIEYVAELDDEHILDWIKDGTIKHCSVEYDWSKLEKVDGVAPKGIQFTGLALLKNFEPGDQEATVEVWEGIVKILRESRKTSEQGEPQEFIYYQVVDPDAFLGDRFSSVWIDNRDGIQAIRGRPKDNRETVRPIALLFMKANGWNRGKIQAWIEDHSEYVEGHEKEPSAFSVPPSSKPVGQINSVAERKVKDQEDETEREKLRQAQRERAEKYGISPKEGGHLTKPQEYADIPEDQFADPVNYRYPIDADHVQAGLTYFNQPDNRRTGGYTHEESVRIMVKIVNAALNNGVEVSWQPEDPVYRDLPEELKRKLSGYQQKSSKESVVEEQELTIEELKQQIEDLTRKREELQQKVAELVERLGEAVIDASAEPYVPEGYIRKDAVVQSLRRSVFERVPYHWGYGPYEQNRRIKALIKRLERGPV